MGDSALGAPNGITWDAANRRFIVVPYGGGGLSCGIASAVRQLAPSCAVYAAEVETAAPLGCFAAASRARNVFSSSALALATASTQSSKSEFRALRQSGSCVRPEVKLSSCARVMAAKGSPPRADAPALVVVDGGHAPVAALCDGRPRSSCRRRTRCGAGVGGRGNNQPRGFAAA